MPNQPDVEILSTDPGEVKNASTNRNIIITVVGKSVDYMLTSNAILMYQPRHDKLDGSKVKMVTVEGANLCLETKAGKKYILCSVTNPDSATMWLSRLNDKFNENP